MRLAHVPLDDLEFDALMTSNDRLPSSRTACPWCGASERTAWGTCQGCGRYYRPEGWTRVPRRRSWWIVVPLLVVALLYAWLHDPFVPDLVTLFWKRPATLRSSDSPTHQWAMWGRDLAQRRYIAEATQALEGRRVWSVSTGVPTRSAPVLVDNVLYLGGHFACSALDAQTGARLWEVPLSGPVHTALAVAGDALYLGLQDWRVLALERQTGARRWEFSMQNPVAGAAAVAHGMVYIGSMDGFLYALDAATGRLIWQFKTQDQALSPPAFAENTLFMSSTDGSLYALNARTGQRWLRFRTPERLHDTPVVAHGLVYFPAGGQLFAIAADAYEIPGQFQFKQVWAQFWLWGFPVPRPPGQPGGRWRFVPSKTRGKILAAPAVAADALYAGDTQGMLYAREVLTGTELWQFQARGAITASPVVVGSQVYVGTEDGLFYALERDRGTLRWQLDLGAPLQLPPVFASGRLYLRTSDGQVHAVE